MTFMYRKNSELKSFFPQFTFFHPKIRSASGLNNFITSIEKVSCRSGYSLSYFDMLFCVHALGLLCHGIFKSPGNRRRKIRRRKTDCFCNYLIIVLIYYINNINFYSISALNTLEISSKYFTPFKIELQISKTMRK